VCHTLWKTLSSVRSEKNTKIKHEKSQCELRKVTCIAMTFGGSAIPEVIATELSAFNVRCGVMISVTGVCSVMRTVLHSVRVRCESFHHTSILKYCLMSGNGLTCPIVSPSKKENV
jgi:hypothetical protein